MYEISERTTATPYGGIAAVHALVRRLGLVSAIDRELHFFKVHKPYHESDHILSLVYNILAGGECLDDIEVLRNDPAFMDSIGAHRIPDPTTAGDFLRRFEREDLTSLMNIMHEMDSRALFLSNGGRKRARAILDIDSHIAETSGETKEKMDISYDGRWGFHPLIITEATTGMHVSIVNRSGNEASQKDAAKWIDDAIQKTLSNFKRVLLRGDTAFSLTGEFDRWTDSETEFVFGFDATPKMREMAEKQPVSGWKRLRRKEHRAKQMRSRVKEERIVARNYRNLSLVREYISEFRYTPTKCKQSYRVIAVRKMIRQTGGDQLPFELTRYFFYITNIANEAAEDVLNLIMGRCNHENRIEQLKNGVSAMRCPTYGFIANWAYMLICLLAWNIKSWFGLLSGRKWGRTIIGMEFKRFIRGLIQIPAAVIHTGRILKIRILNLTPMLAEFFAVFDRIQALPVFG